MRLSELFRQAAFAQATGKAPVTLVTLSHATWSGAVRLSDGGDITSRGELYLGGAEIVLPEESREGTRPWTIAAWNANLALDELRQTDGEVGAIAELVFDDDPDTVLLTISGGRITEVRWTGLLVEADVEWPSHAFLRYPEHDFVPTLFPGMFA